MYNDELYHTGRKGMRWGQHIYGRLYKRSDGSLTELGRKRARAYAAKYRKLTGHKVSQSQSDDKTTKSKTAKKSVSEMSDSELQSRIDRLRLEQRYNELNPKQISAGKKLIETVFKPAASEASKQLMKEWMVKAGREAMGLNSNNNNNNNSNNRRNRRSSTS